MFFIDSIVSSQAIIITCKVVSVLVLLRLSYTIQFLHNIGEVLRHFIHYQECDRHFVISTNDSLKRSELCPIHCMHMPE